MLADIVGLHWQHLKLDLLVQIVRLVGERGLRGLGTSRNPEASLTGALSRDSSLFARLKPGTYALQVSRQLLAAIAYKCLGDV